MKIGEIKIQSFRSFFFPPSSLFYLSMIQCTSPDFLQYWNSVTIVHYVKGCVCAQSCRLFVAPWTVAHQASLSMRFSRQEYWSGLPFSSPGDLPNPGIEPVSLASPALTGATWKPT